MPGVVGMKSGKHLDLPKWADEFLGQIDARSRLGLKLHRRLDLLEWDVSAGDPGRLNYIQRSLIRRALWLEARLEIDEAMIVTDTPVSAGSHSTLLNSLTNVYRLLGVNPTIKRVPTLHEYIDQQDEPE